MHICGNALYLAYCYFCFHKTIFVNKNGMFIKSVMILLMLNVL